MKSSLGKEIVLTDKGNTNIIGYYDDAGAEDEVIRRLLLVTAYS
jgi:hypothetical protein